MSSDRANGDVNTSNDNYCGDLELQENEGVEVDWNNDSALHLDEEEDDIAIQTTDEEHVYENSMLSNGHNLNGEGSKSMINGGHTNIDDDFKDENYEKDQKSTIMTKAVEFIKSVYSCALLGFSVAVVMAGIFTQQTVGTAERGIHPVLAFVLFWFLIVYLAMMEGGQGCLVGLQLVDPKLYADSHPRTLKNTKLSHKGNNLERFIVGRQFLAVLVIFVSNLMSSAIDGASVFGMPDLLNEIFLESGVALILTTITLGQLTGQVNAAQCMLDFVNNYFMLYFVTHVSLLIEFSGILHVVYLVRIFFSKLTGKEIDSNEATPNMTQTVFFWSRVVVSVSLLGFAFAVTLSALFSGKTTMWEGVPPYASVIIFFVLMCFVGLMEGMQIALFAVINMPEDELKHHAFARKTCDLTFSGQNLQAFLIGRQILVTICMFVVARITTLKYTAADDNVFGVSDGVQEFFNTGLLGALITTIVASLIWRIIASSSPVAFLSNPLVYLIVRVCLIFEASGLCSSSWVLARIHKRILRYKPDEVYLGKPDHDLTKAVDLVRRKSSRLSMLSPSSPPPSVTSSLRSIERDDLATAEAAATTAPPTEVSPQSPSDSAKRKSILRLSKNMGSTSFSSFGA